MIELNKITNKHVNKNYLKWMKDKVVHQYTEQKTYKSYPKKNTKICWSKK